MKRLFRVVVAALALVPCAVLLAQGPRGGIVEQKGSFLRPLQQRDSVLIADQLEYGFRLEGVEEGTVLALADYKNGLMDSVEIVRSWKIDTVKVNKAKKGQSGSYDIEGSIVITSFDEGVYMLPNLYLGRRVGSTIDTLVFDPQVLDVKTMPVDTATFQIHDIKGQIKYPVTFAEVMPYVAGVLLLAFLVSGIIWYINQRKKKIEAELAKEPAYIIALRKLDKYRGDKFWAPEKQKTFYSGITDAIREYMADRYEVDALEMTTAEIFTALKDKEIPKDLYLEMKELFERADFVKFAKHVADDQENASAVPTAVRFVTTTYQEVLEEESSEADKTSEQTPKDDSKSDDNAPEEKDYSAYMPK